MKPFLFWTEVFYSPRAFVRLRGNQRGIEYFSSGFPLIAYMVLAGVLARGLGFSLNFLQFFLAVVGFYLIGFLKTCVYSALLNADSPQASWKEVWLWNAVSLYPLLIFLPFLSLLVQWRELFLAGLLGVLFFSNFLKTRYLSRFYRRKIAFVWVVSLLEFLGALLVITLLMGAGLLFFAVMTQSFLSWMR